MLTLLIWPLRRLSVREELFRSYIYSRSGYAGLSAQIPWEQELERRELLYIGSEVWG